MGLKDENEALKAQIEKLTSDNESLKKKAEAKGASPEQKAEAKATAISASAKREPIDLAAEGYAGKYVEIKGDKAEIWGLKILKESDPEYRYGRSHHLKSQLHTWEGTEEQFRLKYEKA